MNTFPVGFFQNLVWMLIHRVSNHNKLLQNTCMPFAQEIWYQKSYLCPPAKEMSW